MKKEKKVFVEANEVAQLLEKINFNAQEILEKVKKQNDCIFNIRNEAIRTFENDAEKQNKIAKRQKAALQAILILLENAKNDFNLIR